MKQTKQNYFPIIAAGCLFAVNAMFCLDLYAPSLPAIATTLQLSQETARGLTVIFFFGLSFSMLFYGILSDAFGRKPLIVFALGLGCIANLLCGFATSGTTLLILRFITGVSAAGCLVTSRALLRDKITNKSELIRGFAIYAMAAQLSPAIAPTVGGVIQHLFSWRGDFWFLSIMMGVTTCFALWKFRETIEIKRPLHIETLKGTFRVLLTNKLFMSYSILSGIMLGFIMVFFSTAPFILQNGYGISPLETGLYLLLLPVSFVFGSSLTRYLARCEIDTNKLLTTYVLSFLLLSMIVVLVSWQLHSFLTLIGLSLFLGLLCGLFAPVVMGLSMSMVSGPIGLASAIQGTIKMLATAVSLLISLVINAKTTTDLGLILLMLALLLNVVFFVMNALSRKSGVLAHSY